MRERADSDKLTACAITPVDQCVPCAAIDSNVRVMSASTIHHWLAVPRNGHGLAVLHHLDQFDS
jgi:hypothetical protein